MEITRRSLLGASAAAGAGLLLPLHLKTAANAAVPLGVTPFTEALPTLAEMGVIDATKGGTAKIRMVNATHSFHTAMGKTPTFAYRSDGGVQDYLGPVIVAKRNVPFKLTVVNELGVHPLAGAMDFGIDGAVPLDATAPRAAVHLHGGNTDPANDGDPLDFFGHGASKTYHYGNTQEAAGLWFHDHALGITRLNVFAGLAGGYLVRDANDPGDGSLLPAPPYEVPLVVQDRMFNDDGTFELPPRGGSELGPRVLRRRGNRQWQSVAQPGRRPGEVPVPGIQRVPGSLLQLPVRVRRFGPRLLPDRYGRRSAEQASPSELTAAGSRGASRPRGRLRASFGRCQGHSHQRRG